MKCFGAYIFDRFTRVRSARLFVLLAADPSMHFKKIFFNRRIKGSDALEIITETLEESLSISKSKILIAVI